MTRPLTMSAMAETTRSRITARASLLPLLAIGLTLAAAVFELRLQARIWWCACRKLKLFAADIWSAHNSQHWFDPYSFTHILHGLVFYGIIVRLLPRVSFAWRFCLAIVLEASWEVLENTQFIIQRYRQAPIGLGYEGDSIVNSLGDILFCSIGFLLARYLGLRWSLVLLVATELALLFWVRDNLTLNILMLIHPIEAIKSWQMSP